MISDDKRREVAARLRGLDMSDIDVDGRIIDSPKYVGLLLMRMLDVTCDYRDGLHYFPGFFSAQAVVELFADLIDPTCEVESVEPIEYGEFNETIGYAYNLTCGHIAMRACTDTPPSYCEECGARVVR